MMEFWTKNKRTLLFLAGITGVVSVPLMTDYLLTGSNLATTLSQIQVICQGFSDRIFPIRIGTLESMEYGYSAVSFQAKVFYVIPALLHFLGMEIGSAYKWTLFFFHLLTAVISYGCFSRCAKRTDVGIIGSMLYTWNPYRCSEMYLVGDLGEIAGWTFIPLILLGIMRLFTREADEKADNNSWVILTLGFSLLAVSSTTLLFMAVVVFGISFLLMGKDALKKKTLLEIGKAAVATLWINAWFLIPMLLRMSDTSAVMPMLVKDVRERGMYFTQYLITFSGADTSILFHEKGMRYAQAMGPGIAVILLLFLCLWLLFTQKIELQNCFMKNMLVVAVVLMILSTKFFPWDLLQNGKFVFSVILAFMYTPAKLGIGAGAVMILVVCIMLGYLAEIMENRNYKLLLLVVAFVSFGTTQYQLERILTTVDFVRREDMEAMTSIPFSLIVQESIIWRISEVLSVAAVLGCILMWIMRRKKGVKNI